MANPFTKNILFCKCCYNVQHHEFGTFSTLVATGNSTFFFRIHVLVIYSATVVASLSQCLRDEPTLVPKAVFVDH